MDHLFPLFVNTAKDDGTHFIMIMTFLSGTGLLFVHNFFASDDDYDWDSIDTFISIVGYVLIAAGISTALIGATMVLATGKWLGLGVLVFLSIWTIWKSIRSFAKHQRITLPSWLKRQNTSSSSSRADGYR